jgi:hypothetical protein
MTAPGPFRLLESEVPNLVVGTFPFVYLPGFLAPTAVALHVLSLRGLASRQDLPLTPPRGDGA